MYAVSERWEMAVKQSHAAIARLDVVRGENMITSFPVIDGNLTQDYEDPTRWGLDVIFVDDEGRSIDDMQDLVDPMLMKLVPYVGIKYPDGTEELVQCGEHYAKDVELVEYRGAPMFRLNCFDASTRLQRGLSEPYYIASGRDPLTVVPELLMPRFPRLTVQTGGASGFETPVLLLREDAIPWTEARMLVASTGRILAVNRLGYATPETRIVDALTVDRPAWRFDEERFSDFGEIRQRTTVDDVPNVIVVRGSHPDFPTVRGEAADMNPRSRTYRYSPSFGEQVKTIRSERVRTDEQANAMASGELARLLGGSQEITIPAIRNPALDVGDVVEVTRARVGLYHERMIVTHVELPLTVRDWMQVTCRKSIGIEEQEIQS